MEVKILQVVRQGEAFSVPSQKSETGQIMKCSIVLRELGGSKFENEEISLISELKSLYARSKADSLLVPEDMSIARSSAFERAFAP